MKLKQAEFLSANGTEVTELSRALVLDGIRHIAAELRAQVVADQIALQNRCVARILLNSSIKQK